jgi:hypothetical protein
MKEALNDDPTAFQTFLSAYWNQMADELYADFGEALSDFRVTEGDRSYKRLMGELAALHAGGRFLPVARVQSAYHDPFWKGYGRIVVLEDLETSGILSDNGS